MPVTPALKSQEDYCESEVSLGHTVRYVYTDWPGVTLLFLLYQWLHPHLNLSYDSRPPRHWNLLSVSGLSRGPVQTLAS